MDLVHKVERRGDVLLLHCGRKMAGGEGEGEGRGWGRELRTNNGVRRIHVGVVERGWERGESVCMCVSVCVCVCVCLQTIRSKREG